MRALLLLLAIALFSGCTVYEQDGKVGIGKPPKRWHEEPLDQTWHYDSSSGWRKE